MDLNLAFDTCDTIVLLWMDLTTILQYFLNEFLLIK